MATNLIRTRVIEPLSGEEFGVRARIYSDGVVLTSAVRYESLKCDAGKSHPVVIGGEFRGFIRKVDGRWTVLDVNEAPFPVTFATRREALADTVGLALDNLDRSVC